MGLSVERRAEVAAVGTMLNRLPTLADVAETIAFLSSDHAQSMTATVVNLTAGATA
jgi:NAD(P)-dependent dehydrogenase (short-subunit alcohol dehydrogenase family)